VPVLITFGLLCAGTKGENCREEEKERKITVIVVYY